MRWFWFYLIVAEWIRSVDFRFQKCKKRWAQPMSIKLLNSLVSIKCNMNLKSQMLSHHTLSFTPEFAQKIVFIWKIWSIKLFKYLFSSIESLLCDFIKFIRWILNLTFFGIILFWTNPNPFCRLFAACLDLFGSFLKFRNGILSERLQNTRIESSRVRGAMRGLRSERREEQKGERT